MNLKNEQEIENISRKNYFTPFIEGIIFCDSYQKLCFKCKITANTQSFSLKDAGEISVLQNFINRGKMVRSFDYNLASSLIMTSILEAKKHGNDEKLYFTGPKIMNDFFEDSKLELRFIINSYNKILEKDISYLLDSLDEKNIEFVVNDTDNEISISTEDKTILEFDSYEYNDQVDPINFVTDDFVQYVEFINDKGETNLKAKSELDNFLRVAFYEENFKVSKLKQEQLIALNNILINKTNTLAVLKTGFGKSMIYQFLSLLQPNLMIVVFPINALIEDQSINLKKTYNLNYVMDNNNLRKDQISETTFTKKRLFLITPERIENEKFQNIIIKYSKFIGTLVFDEAHCISEWGHDFRPSYLVVRHVMKNIQEKNEDFNVIALTATASPFVQRDVCQNLGIKRSGLINIADTKGLVRKELSFSMQKVDTKGYSEENWLYYIHEKFEQLKDLDGTKIFYFMRVNSKYRISALPTYNYLNKYFNHESIGLFTGKSKKINNISYQPKFEDFRKVKTIIATKSFGMGINLSNCNYVGLIELPSSLEDLYQQAGRAGRKGQNSIVDVFYNSENLLDPMQNSFSSHKWFLETERERIALQPKFLKELIKEIINKNDSIILNLRDFYNKMGIKNDIKYDNYLKFAISHLINELEIIDFYTIKYNMVKIEEIKIHINKKIDITDVKEKLDNVLNKYSLEYDEQKRAGEKINLFYEWYFDEIQKQKILGFNIMRNRLLSFDEREEKDHNKFIYGILNEYYKSKEEELYSGLDLIFENLKREYDLKNIKDSVNDLINAMGENNFIEEMSRYKINIDYIKILSLIAYLEHSIKPVALSIDDLFDIDNDYLNNLKEKEIKFFLENKTKDLEKIESIMEYFNKINETEFVETFIKSLVVERILNGY